MKTNTKRMILQLNTRGLSLRASMKVVGVFCRESRPIRPTREALTERLHLQTSHQAKEQERDH